MCVIQCIDFLSIANNTINFNGLLEYKLQYQQVVHHFCITRCTHVNTFENYVDHIVLHCAKKMQRKKPTKSTTVTAIPLLALSVTAVRD